MNQKIYYFGYGANRNPSMMKAIIGRVPQGRVIEVSGFELCIQNWQEMTPQVRKMLSGSWDSEFRSYILRPAENMEKRVRGMLWELTPDERKLIDNWEMTGTWYSVFLVELAKENTHLEIQVVNDPDIKHKVNGRFYDTFVNPKDKMFTVAKKCREQFLKSGLQA